MRKPVRAVYGVVAEFAEPEEIIQAVERTREAGYRSIDAFTPMPVHGLSEALHFEDNRVPWLTFFGGLAGAFTGYGMQWWISAVNYPLDIGGRPYHSWPNFVPVTFEMTILFAGLTAFFGMLALNGMPKPYHPIFDAENFDRASQDRFFLCIMSDDPKYDDDRTKDFLHNLDPRPLSVSTVSVPEDGLDYFPPVKPEAAEVQH